MSFLELLKNRGVPPEVKWDLELRRMPSVAEMLEFQKDTRRSGGECPSKVLQRLKLNYNLTGVHQAKIQGILQPF